jgi:dienelactone hydrolase
MKTGFTCRLIGPVGLLSFLLSFSFLLTFQTVEAQDKNELNVIRNNWMLYSDAPNSLYHYLTGQAYELLRKRDDEVNAINSLAGWQARQDYIKKTLLDIVGPFPEKNPLNAKILRTVEKEYFRVEHIVFESQPGFFVTSSMFIPNSLKKRAKAPVIIYVSGHSDVGYRSDVYQRVILNLVKKNFIVFAFDPVGQGERQQYYDPEIKKSTIGGPTAEHSYPGSHAFITGSSQARYMIWDGIRAVDYLLTRKEVDPSRIGITGRSGGGTQSAYIAAMDDRIYACAPENYLTTFTRLLQTIGPQDAEQNMFNMISRGLDHPDYLIVRAPKPALMITTTRDMFSIQGVREHERQVAGIYEAYGKSENFSRTEDDAPHASTEKNRVAMYAFFQKSLNNPGNSNDEVIVPLTNEEIQVTPTGQVSTSFQSETVYSLNRKEAEKRLADLNSARANFPVYLEGVISSARKLSGYIAPEGVSDPVFTGRIQNEGYAIEKYFVKGEGEYVFPYLLFIPAEPNGKAIIYIHPDGKAVEASENGEIAWLARNGMTVLAPDLIGTGETGSGNYKGDAYIAGTSHNVWYASILIGRSIAGVRAADMVRAAMILKKRDGIKEIYGIARGEMAPVLLHAAAFYPDIKKVALLRPYSSYLSIVMNRFYQSSYIINTVPAALKAYDLPDLAASLAPRKLLIAGTVDGNGKSDDQASINRDLEVIRNAYNKRNASGQLNISPLESGVKTFDLLNNWLK